MSTTESVLDHHWKAFGEQDLEATLEDYTDESVVVTQADVFRGREEIEGLFEGMFAEFSDSETSITLEERIVEGDFGYIVWQAETPDNDYEFATDTFYIPDGEIVFQTFAGKITPKD